MSETTEERNGESAQNVLSDEELDGLDASQLFERIGSEVGEITELFAKAIHNINAGFKTVEETDEAIRLEPDNAMAFDDRARVYFADDDFDRAIADSTEAIRLKPDNARYFANRALAYSRKLDHDSVIADSTDVFRGMNKSSIRLYVPENSIETYKAASGWENFTLIFAAPGAGTEKQT